MRRPERPADMTGEKLADYEYERRKLALRVSDLQRYGIQTVLVDEYSEITAILRELNRRAFLKNIFVSGSASEGLPAFQLERLCGFSRILGKEIIKRGYNLVSGYGWGIGSELIVGALDAADTKFSTLHDRLVLRPFPRSLEDGRKQKVFREWREAMLALSGISIYIAGNKPDRDTKRLSRRRRDPEFEIGDTAAEHLRFGRPQLYGGQIWNGDEGPALLWRPGREGTLAAFNLATITDEQAIKRSSTL